MTVCTFVFEGDYENNIPIIKFINYQYRKIDFILVTTITINNQFTLKFDNGLLFDYKKNFLLEGEIIIKLKK